MTVPSPKHFWRFDEGTGTQSADTAGGATMTLDSASFRAGKATNAVRCHPGDGARVGTTGLADLPPPWTASMWVHREEDSQSASLLSSSGDALRPEQRKDLHTVGITRFADGTDPGFDDSSAYQTPLRQWVQLVLVGTPSDTKLYVNGVLQASFGHAISLPLKWVGSTGGYSDVGAFLLDELKVFDQALTAEQVAELSNLASTRVVFGQTQPGVGWVIGGSYGGVNNILYIDVDTSSYNFASTPMYIANVTTTSPEHFPSLLLGGSAPYDVSAHGFKILIKFDRGMELTQKLTPELAAQKQFQVTWVAFEGASSFRVSQ
jgi:hypothetical protein